MRARDLAGNIDDNSVEISATTKAVSFSGEIMPAILTKCQGGSCHSGFRPQENLELSTAARSYMELVNVRSLRCSPTRLVAPGSPDTSYLVAKLVGTGTSFVGSRMPLSAPQIPAGDMLRLRSWITSGAPNN